MKNFFYYLLIGTIVFTTLGLSSNLNVSAASASSINDAFKGNEGEKGYYSEAFELNGVHYFYEDTEKYTLTITKSLNGEEVIAYKDKNGKDDEFYFQYKPGITKSVNEPTVTYDTNTKITQLDSIDVKYLENIKEEVLSNERILEKHSIQDFATVIDLTEGEEVNLLEAGTSSASKVNSALTGVYGSQYTFKYLTSMTRDGYTGYLYEHMTFGATPKTSFFFNALTAIGIVATAVGTPISGLLGIAAWVSAAGGSYQLLKPTDFDTWNAKVYLQKEVKVASVYPYRAFYDRGLTAVTGDQGTAALSSVNSTYKSNDYDSNSSLLNTGITNYILYHR